MPEPPYLEVLRTDAAFASILPEWQDLWTRDPHGKPFQRPEWLLPWWRNFAQPDLHVVCIRRQQRMVGLLPTYVYRDPVSGERKLLLIGAGTSDYLDGCFAPECSSEDVGSALRLLSSETSWDAAYLSQLLPSSPLYRALLDDGYAASPGESCSFCPALTIRDLPKKVRADVRYFHNAAIAGGKLRLEIADRNSCASFFEQLIQLHTASWEMRHQSGVLADPCVLAWHRECVPLLQSAGLMRLYRLVLNDEAVAVLYALIDGPGRLDRTSYHYLVGYSPDHAVLRPGTLLTAMASEHAALEGITRIDMLRGDEEYKRFWRVQQIPTYGFRVERDAFRAST